MRANPKFVKVIGEKLVGGLFGPPSEPWTLKPTTPQNLVSLKSIKQDPWKLVQKTSNRKIKSRQIKTSQDKGTFRTNQTLWRENYAHFLVSLKNDQLESDVAGMDGMAIN